MSALTRSMKRIGSNMTGTTKPTAHQMSWYIASKKERKKERAEARALARRIIWYFGYEPIRPSLDADTALRDMALALLGQPQVGCAEVPDKIWKKVFRGASKDHRLFSTLGVQ